MKKEEVLAFTEQIEELVYMLDISYMDAIITYCEDTGLEVEMAAKLISNPMEEKIRREAEKLKLIHKSANTSLPI